MDDVMVTYENLALEEDTLVQRIRVCEDCVSVILDYISNKNDSTHILTVEDIVSAIHVIEQDLQTELLHLKLEKGVLANKIKWIKYKDSKENVR
ncbi:hypothetical protein [Paenibacillus eucommiae]|uniref:Uncharacterized protein n=1 Tax=Paenibacillus eucommiae TaxID=1355755 RepID=A0ABS4IYD5_9BACL|nr:hypothetical protein [Paenibacillus eucommiae]MBP1991886.1 hypothetical protein [Paenibacillus eucommiae]